VQQGPLDTPLTHIQLSALMQQPLEALTATTGTFAGLLTAAGSGTGLSVTNNATIGGTATITGNFAVATTKFTVAAATGNTVVAGTLGVTGASSLAALTATTIAGTTGAFSGDFAVATNKFTVAATTGKTVVGGTMDVTGASTLAALSATTGTFSSTATATAFIPTSATIPSNGMYLPAANTLGFAANTTAEMQMTGTALSPAKSDGLALGTTALMWSDMFLASGAVLDFNNGDMTITHGSNVLTIAGGELAVETLLLTAIADGASYDDDAAAASGGIGLKRLYRNGNFLMVRLT
jgi:hypothetical protein